MKELVYVISDVELGRGDIMDGFRHDKELVAFINSIKSRKPDENVTLVFNGDSFDFLKMGYRGKYPRLITEEISLWKINEIHNAHTEVFSALKNFLENKNHKLIFVIGNHDADLAWPGVQEFIRGKISRSHTDKTPNVEFPFRYQKNGLQIEHGHLLDVFFNFDFSKPIINYRGQKILNLSWGCRICNSHLNRVKLRFPDEEKFQPATEYAKQHPAFGKAIKKAVTGIILTELLLRPLFFFYDATRRAPVFKIIIETFRRGFKALSYEQYKLIDFKRLYKKFPQSKLFIFGHTHCLGDLTYKDRRYLVTDTWREEVDIKTMKEKPKTFALVTFEHNKLTGAGLKTFG